jgi:hypothetical protein
VCETLISVQRYVFVVGRWDLLQVG